MHGLCQMKANRSTESSRRRKAKDYVKSLRNENKRLYADAYFKYVIAAGDRPNRGVLSVMGAQAVRMVIDEIMEVD